MTGLLCDRKIWLVRMVAPIMLFLWIVEIIQPLLINTPRIRLLEGACGVSVVLADSTGELPQPLLGFEVPSCLQILLVFLLFVIV